MRIPLAQPFKSRTGVPDKDSRLKNSYVEVKGDKSIVRKRPIAQGDVAVGTGTAQGGIGFTINGTPYFIGVWGDTLTNYTGNGTTWNSGTTYPQGSMVSYGFSNFWSVDDSEVTPTPNVNNDPETTPSRWSRTPTYCKSPIIPAPVVIGTSQEYTGSAIVPADVVLSDVSKGYYCAGQLRKKVVVSYSVGSAITGGYKAGPNAPYGQGGITAYGDSWMSAATNWYAQVIYNSCANRWMLGNIFDPTVGIWTGAITNSSGSMLRCITGSAGAGIVVGAPPCPGITSVTGVADMTAMTTYLLTATTTESYYIL